MKKHLTGSKFMLFLLIWFVVAQLLIVGVLQVFASVYDLDINAISASPWLIIVTQLTALLLPLFVWLYIKKDSFKKNMPNWALGTKNIVIITLLSFLLQPVMMTVSGISSLFFTNYVSETIYAFMEYPLWLIILAMAVTPAVVEELVFRGYLQTQHQDRNIHQAALLNGLFFGIIHLNMQQFAYAFFMGIIFAYMVYYTRSIWAGILPHFIVNATQGIIGRLAFAPGAYETLAQVEPERLITSVSPEVEAIIIIGIFALMLSPIIFVLARAFVRHNRWRVKYLHQEQPAEMPRYDEYYANQANAMHTASPHLHPRQWPYPSENESADGQAYPPAGWKPPFFDRYAIWVIIIFIAFTAMMLFP